jgi:hypothetical protein
MILLFFGRVEHPIVSHPTDAELLVEIWDVKHRLASTGLFLDEESKQIVPCWTNWAIVSAKRRTILALHHLEWAWSLLHGYPGLACFELGPLPAPAAGYLWREQSEKEWEHLYNQWLSRWKGDGYKLGELFRIKPGVEMDERSEMWLTEVDEFGMMVMSEGKLPRPISCVCTDSYSKCNQQCKLNEFSRVIERNRVGKAVPNDSTLKRMDGNGWLRGNKKAP